MCETLVVPSEDTKLPTIGDLEEKQEEIKEPDGRMVAEVIQAKMAGLNDEEIKERIKKRYNLDDVEAEMTLQMVMKFLEKRQDQEFQLKKATLGVIPALAQSNNPLAPLLMQNLLAQITSKDDDDDLAKEFLKIQKTAMRIKMLKEAMKVDEEEGGKKGDYDDVLKALILEMIKDMKADRDKKEELLYKLLLEKKDDGSNVKDVLADLIDYLDQRLQMIADAVQRSEISGIESRQKDPFDDLTELSEKLKRITEALEALGFKVEKPDDKDPFKAIELQMKLKELELKHKEAEARRAFMEKIGDALANLIGNPQNLQILLNAITGILKGGPAPTIYEKATSTAVSNMPAPEPPKVEELPDIDDFMEGGQNG